MRARLSITDDSGKTFSGEIELLPEKTGPKPVKESPKRALGTALDFDLPDRAFVRRYAKDLSGPQKFVLVIAFLAHGSVGKEVPLKDIQRLWNRMTASNLLGYRFNRFYSTTAREEGWVTIRGKGVYTLRNSWKDVFSSAKGRGERLK
jgi:hypothetical protein